jgi:acyl transferase domain-containing protein
MMKLMDVSRESPWSWFITVANNISPDCRGEGVGTIILKRLEDAIADKDPIRAVISGAYTNHSAESESITRPHVGAQRAIFKKILNQAAVDPYDVSYVEMHGTSRLPLIRSIEVGLTTKSSFSDQPRQISAMAKLHLGFAD